MSSDPPNFCTECGAPVEPGAAFCVACGHRLEGVDDMAPGEVDAAAEPAGEATAESDTALRLGAVDVEVVEAYRREHGTAVLCVAFGDVVDADRLREDLGADRFAELREDHVRRVTRIVEREGSGRLVKWLDARFLAVFAGTSQAIERCLELHEDAIRSGPLRMRIGLDLGRVARSREMGTLRDAFATLVSRASRIEARADPGSVLTTFPVYDATVGWLKSGGVEWRHHGRTTLEGLGEPLTLHEPHRPGASAARRTREGVVFAQAVAGPGVYEELGEAGTRSAVFRVLEALEALSVEKGGRCIKRLGDGVLSAFPDATSAVRFAVSAHRQLLLYSGGVRLELRSGVNFGPLVKDADGDVYGDTVNVAARLRSLASPGQLITTQETFDAVEDEPLVTRGLGWTVLAGKHQRVQLVELLWEEQQAGNLTFMPRGPMLEAITDPLAIELALGDVTAVLRTADQGDLSLGREPSNTLTVAAESVSRRHATIQVRNGKFYITDHSTNGTFLRMGENQPVAVRRETVPIHGSGEILLGREFDERTGDVIRYEVRELDASELEDQGAGADEETPRAVDPYAAAMAALAARADGSARVLWVDQAGVSEPIRAAVAGSGVTIEAVSTTREAVQRLAEGDYAVLVSDVGPPGGSPEGIEMLRGLRERGQAVPCVFFTPPNSAFLHEDAAREAGASACTFGTVSLLHALLEALVG